MNISAKTRPARRLLRPWLLVLMLPLAGCTTYVPVYSDDYRTAVPAVSVHAPVVHGAGLAVYPYWSLDYFYFSQHVHPYSVLVSYHAPFYVDYPGWVYGSAFGHPGYRYGSRYGYRGSRYGARFGYDYPWAPFGVHDPYYSYGFFASYAHYGYRNDRRHRLRAIDRRARLLADQPRIVRADRLDRRSAVGYERRLRERRFEQPVRTRWSSAPAREVRRAPSHVGTRSAVRSEPRRQIQRERARREAPVVRRDRYPNRIERSQRPDRTSSSSRGSSAPIDDLRRRDYTTGRSRAETLREVRTRDRAVPTPNRAVPLQSRRVEPAPRREIRSSSALTGRTPAFEGRRYSTVPAVPESRSRARSQPPVTRHRGRSEPPRVQSPRHVSPADGPRRSATRDSRRHTLNESTRSRRDRRPD